MPNLDDRGFRINQFLIYMYDDLSWDSTTQFSDYLERRVKQMFEIGIAFTKNFTFELP